MAEHIQLCRAPREQLLEAARRELAKFELQESEFRKKNREQHAAKLRLPLDKIKVR
ncbi:hypothetical protein [Bradyrhizobium sp. CCBAU 11386]|uniref:hypothetical protein n=1 Tax=Bradyrhizobium sp. CCBAU 11386 TaxID=1630837 RepID=UPI0023043A52|nr:hypothetical protein [Bradyrhizobium sp. CCBAU 11386]